MVGDFERYYEAITQGCMAAFGGDTPPDLTALATELMGMDGFPMHAPVHHYLVPAVLLTVCRRAQSHGAEVLERDLALALERSRGVPGGACGFYGACGACVGVGIFWSVITDATPLSVQSWAWGNGATGRALLEIAAVGGPRCCKRCTWLSLRSTVAQIHEVLGLEVRAPEPSCQFHDRNQECLKGRCPYYPGTPITLPVFSYPKKDPEHPCPCQDRPVELTHKTGKLFWVKAPGEAVVKDEPAAELEVEKKTLVIPAPVSGVLKRQCVLEGEEVGVGAVIGYIEEGEDG